ncbi:acetyltransferase [Campylobacter hyointestinalis]|uniref:Acetyltransferase n=1 Tax=Campylobacter hyointestinalis subsp. hyointestinalis TaxID=91352 RepID=A0A0S4SQ20_CAMHY|nr:GNAT family N-acetyltransferase [Campylobacter hyointestinalis]ANE32170.1 putative acetyltransferase (GNAT family protein) [Campylobacter hyointestinalis subsp. hyointestinalis LMG 9260]KEA43868.1 diadenosine tetraphosphatase [Campylobacter hyointestinalis subsp. hyointestinalis]PPB54696.1 N-acetyltransferase [Campylobacter hyointestinalis subsp. hyointestinalis]PPB56529.1 N-acetyltransferase [Campylobacter hyointestinalis subsp. hyointestinalis]PPB67976.1 N-acetyltransferase [Campylobacter
MFEIREAKKEDLDSIINLIKELAKYENMEDQITFTKDDYEKSLFEKQYAKALVCEYKNNIIGYAIYFYSFSTFLGKGGIYLEDLYIQKEFRNKGIGKKILKTLAQICINENLGRLEWACLDWNEPSLAFYKKIGAKTLDEWISLRVDGQNLIKLADI